MILIFYKFSKYDNIAVTFNIHLQNFVLFTYSVLPSIVSYENDSKCALPLLNETVRFKKRCVNTNIYAYLETSSGQSSNPYLNVVHVVKILFCWLLFFRLYKSYRQVLTPVNNSQLLFKAGNSRQVQTCYISQKHNTKKLQHFNWFKLAPGETGVFVTLNHRASEKQRSSFKCADIFTLTWF
jgi:hypothetical protein